MFYLMTCLDKFGQVWTSLDNYLIMMNNSTMMNDELLNDDEKFYNDENELLNDEGKFYNQKSRNMMVPKNEFRHHNIKFHFRVTFSHISPQPLNQF